LGKANDLPTLETNYQTIKNNYLYSENKKTYKKVNKTDFDTLYLLFKNYLTLALQADCDQCGQVNYFTKKEIPNL